VALIEEGIELREAGIVAPILVMGSHYGNAWGELIRHRLTPVLSRPDQLASLGAEVRFASGPRAPVHVKIDTGMARVGVSLADLDAFAQALAAQPELELDGVMTHFASAESDAGSVTRQLDLFDGACEVLARHGLVAPRRHAANTAATLGHPRSRLDLVRVGIGLFGMAPGVSTELALTPVMRVRTEIVAQRSVPVGGGVGYGATWRASRVSQVATIPMGYGDGLSRALSNRGHVLVRGKRAPIIGAVSMDMTSVDVTDVAGAQIGDEVVVLGSQRGPLGEATLTAEEIAVESGTIAWEVLTGVSRRVPRFYRES
jgi:alanine racemase